MILFVAMFIDAIGNLFIFLGPDDFNGFGYMYTRLNWTGFGLPANIIEEYLLLAALLYAIVGLKCAWECVDDTLASGKLNFAISGVGVCTFVIIHLFTFRLGETQEYMIRPPPYGINVEGLITLNPFWEWDSNVAPVAVRNTYKHAFDVFKSSPSGGCLGNQFEGPSSLSDGGVIDDGSHTA